MTLVRDYLRERVLIQNRIILCFIFIALLILALFFRLAYLQVIQHEQYSTLAQNNRFELFSMPPIRGLIYDRNGEILAQNIHVYNLEVLPEKVENMDELLSEIGQFIELTDNDLTRFQKLLKKRPPFEWQTLKVNLNEEESSMLSINQHQYPGIQLRARLQRHYPQGGLVSHLIGYVGRISSDDLDKIDPLTYQGMEYIGKGGVEEFYETTLLGKPGAERVETNAHGRVIRKFEQITPAAGKNIHLSLDFKLQQKSMEALEGYEGAVVAIEPGSGEVLAFASVPTYDPNPFVNGISETEYSVLRSSERKPLFNRALYGRYAPGSTIKGFLSLVGMENNISHNRQSFCPGWYSLPGHTHQYRCWNKSGHGNVDGDQAIIQSCDVYFYRLARLLGIDLMKEGMARFGFGEQTGIDLLGEPAGLMPSREWKKRVRGELWFPGETVITGIGQGYMLTTPLQLASVTATLASRGIKATPKLLTEIEHPQNESREAVPPEVRLVDLKNDRFYDIVIKSMRDVVHGQRGTARRIGQDIPYEMAGKTGTAQVKSIRQNEVYDEENTEKKFRDHSLFVGFAPLDDPKIAIAVIVEHAGSGSKTAAPIARKLLDYYLIERLGIIENQDAGPQAAALQS